MLQGLYAAASGMEAQQNQFNAIANDMANLNTTGYQATEVGFQDLLYSSGGNSSGSPNDRHRRRLGVRDRRPQRRAGRDPEHGPLARRRRSRAPAISRCAGTTARSA